MVILVKAILAACWFGVIFKFGAPNEVIDQGEVYDGIPSEYFDEKVTDEETGPSGMYRLYYRTQFIILYLLLYFLFMGPKLQWLTWRAWFALMISGIVIYWNQVRADPSVEFFSIKKTLTTRLLEVTFAHIALCILLVIF